MRSRQFAFDASSVSSAAFPLLAPNGSKTAPSYSNVNFPTQGIYWNATQDIRVSTGSTDAFRFSPGSSVGFNIHPSLPLSWAASEGGTADVLLYRDTAAVLALKNLGTAQEFRVYGSTTSSKYGSVLHDGTVTVVRDTGGSGIRVGATSANLGFYGTAPVALQTGVALTVTAIKAVLTNLGLCT